MRDFVRVQLGYDLTQPLEATDWLTFSSHALGELIAGSVYQDEEGELTAVRTRFAWYPHDVWLYLLACGWQRIGQKEHLMPRAGSVGDELGSALIGSRLVRDAMNLCFLMEKQYAPYPKWFGTAFKRLRCAPDLCPVLWQAQQAPTWREREAAHAQAYEYLVRMHNTLGIGQKLPETVTRFYTRPFQVIQGSHVAEALIAQISDPEVKQIAERGLIGSFSQWSDNTDMESWSVQNCDKYTNEAQISLRGYCQLVLSEGKNYQELGGHYFDDWDQQALQKGLVRRLEKLGYEVNLEPASPVA